MPAHARCLPRRLASAEIGLAMVLPIAATLGSDCSDDAGEQAEAAASAQAMGLRGTPRTPGTLKASDLYGHWVQMPKAALGSYGYFSLMAQDPRSSRADAYLWLVPGQSWPQTGTFRVREGRVELQPDAVAGADKLPAQAIEILAATDAELALKGGGFGQQTNFERRARCHGPGDLQSPGGGYTAFGWDAAGDLHMAGPELPLLSTRADVCGPIALVALPGAHALVGDEKGTVWAARLAPGGVLELYGFDPADPASLRKEVVATGQKEPGIHTELQLAVRPGRGGELQGMTGVVLVGAGLRSAWEEVDGAWQDAIASKNQSLIPPDIDLLFDPEGRLVLLNGGKVLRESKAGARDFAAWDPGVDWDGVASKRGLLAYDKAGRVHMVTTAHPPKWTPEENSLTRGYDELSHFVERPDGSWQETALGPGLAFDLAFDAKGHLHVMTLPTRKANGGGHLDITLDASGIPASWTYRLGTDHGGATAGGLPQTEYIGLEISQYEHDLPRGRVGPGGSYALIAGWSNPKLEYDFGQDGAPTHALSMQVVAGDDLGAKADVLLPELDVRCQADCTLQLEPRRIYRMTFGGAAMHRLSAGTDAGQSLYAWGWLRGGLVNQKVGELQATVEVKTPIVADAAVWATHTPMITQRAVGFAIDAAGQRWVAATSHDRCTVVKGQPEVLVQRLDDKGTIAAEACWPGGRSAFALPLPSGGLALLVRDADGLKGSG